MIGAICCCFFVLGQAADAAPPPGAPRAVPATPGAPNRATGTAADLLDTMGADWLVHLARHYGHLAGAGDARTRALQALALMQAASDVQPAAPAPYLWQYDLLNRLGRPVEALAALQRYVELKPDEETVWLHFLALRIDALQTAEARVAFLQEQLSQPRLPKAVASDLHRRLAAHYRERNDLAKAGKHVENALRLMPSNVEARRLAYELFGETEPTLQRVELALQLIRASPSQVYLLWELGEVLDSLSLHREAQEWYLRAIEVHERNAKSPVVAEYWFKLAQSYAYSSDLKAAMEAVDKALAADPMFARASVLKSYIAQRAGAKDADAPLNALADRFNAEVDEVIKSRNIAKAVELAWFYAYHRPDKTRALQLAELATSVPLPGSLAERAMGFALLMDNKPAEALARLRPLADVDQMAAVGVARALIQMHKEAEAIPVLHKAALLNASGVAYDEIVRMLERLGEKPPARPTHDKIVQTLQRCDRRVFDFHKRPGDFLKLTLRFLDDSLPAAGPWRVAIRIENVGPFPITLGEGKMAEPLVVLSARLGDDPQNRFDYYMQTLLNSREMLIPGDAVEKIEAVDVGAVRRRALECVDQPLSVELSAMFDPVYSESGYDRGMSSVLATPIRATRPAVATDPGSLQMLIAKSAGPGVADQVAAVDTLGALIVTAVARGQQSPLNADALGRIRRELNARLTDAAWLVRAHAIDALNNEKQGKEVLAAVANAVRDSHPVVRMAAIRFFVTQQGEKFRRVLESVAESDESPAVRLLAKCYLTPKAAG